MKLFKVALLIVLGASSSFAKEGSESGGGGNAIVCRNADYSVKSVELLDLYEARMVYELKFPTDIAPGTENQLAEKILTKGRVTLVQGTMQDFLDRIRFLPPGGKLPPTDDYNTIVPIPLGCDIEGAANYQFKGDGNIYLNPDLWDKMDTLNRAALLGHEIAYRFLRFNRETNSNRARRLVGLVFSDTEIPDPKEDLPDGPGQYEICSTNDATADKRETAVFRTVLQPDGRIRIQFLTLMGKLALSKTTVMATHGVWPVSKNTDLQKELLVDFVQLDSLFESTRMQVQIIAAGEEVGPDQYVVVERMISFWNGETSIYAEFTCQHY